MDKFEWALPKKKVFLDRFKNLLLENYAEDIYSILVEARKQQLNISSMLESRRESTEILEDCAYVLRLALEAKSKGVKSRSVGIKNDRIRKEFALRMEDVLITAIEKLSDKNKVADDLSALDENSMYVVEIYELSDAYEDVQHTVKQFLPITGSFLSDWAKNVDGKLPTPKEIKEVKRPMSIAYLKSLQTKVKSALEEAHNYLIATEEMALNDAVKEILKLGIGLNNAAYRELYIMLDIFGFISDETKASHESNTRKDVKEQFIKAKFIRAKERLI